MYTRVLMGAIDLASVKVPKDTKDGAIDLVTRQYLFEKGLNFKHGTGHGIGAYLKVCTSYVHYEKFDKKSVLINTICQISYRAFWLILIRKPLKTPLCFKYKLITRSNWLPIKIMLYEYTHK